MSVRHFVLVALTALTLIACGSAGERSAEYLERAKESFDAEDYVKAQVDLKNAIQIDPDNIDARLLMVEIAERNGEPRRMFNQLRVIVRRAPENVQARIKLGALLLGASQQDESVLEQVREHIDTALELEPDNPDARVLKASLARRDGDPAGARQQVEAVLAEHPDSIAGTTLLFSLDLPDRPDAALATLDRGLDGAPDSSTLWLLKVGLLQQLERWNEVEQTLIGLRAQFPEEKAVRYRLAKFYEDQDRFDDAERVLSEILDEYPEDTTAKLRYAEFLANHREPTVAEEALRQYTAQHPEVNRFRFALGTLYQVTDRLDEAETMYKAIIERAGTDADGLDARNRLARLYLSQNEVAKAQPLVEAVLKEAETDNDALIMRAAIALDSEQYDSAIADLRTVRRNDPNSVRALTLLSQALLRNGDTNLAEERLRDLIAVDTQNSYARETLARLLASRQDYTGATEILEEGVTGSEQPSIGMTRMLIDVLIGQRRFDEAMAYADQTLAIPGREAFGHFLRGRTFQAQSSFAEAAASYQSAMDLAGPSVEVLSGWMLSLSVLGRAEEARSTLEQYTSDNPDSFQAHTMLGQVHAQGERWDDAKASLGRAIELRPSMFPAYRDLIAVHTRLDERDQALQLAEQGVEAAPDSRDINMLLASVYEQSDRYADAMKQYERVLEIDERFLVAANNLAALIADHDSSDERLAYALELSEKLSVSRNPLFLDTRGWVHYRMGNYVDAVSFLERAAQGVGEGIAQRPEIRYHLGMAYLRSDRPEDAKRELQAAVDTAGDGFEGLDDARTTLASL